LVQFKGQTAAWPIVCAQNIAMLKQLKTNDKRDK